MNPYPESWNYQIRPCSVCGQPARWDRTWDRDTLGKDRVDRPLCPKCLAAQAFDDALGEADREHAGMVSLVEKVFEMVHVRPRYQPAEVGWTDWDFPASLTLGLLTLYRWLPVEEGGRFRGFRYISTEAGDTRVTIPEDHEWLVTLTLRSSPRPFKTARGK